MLSDSIKSLQSTIFIWVWSCHYNSSALCRWLDRYWRWYVWISELKSHVSQYFEMKDLNTLTYFLAHEVSLNDGDYCHTQAKYACHLLLMQVWRAILLFKLLLNQMLNSLSYIGEHLMILLYRKFVGGSVYLTIPRLDHEYVMMTQSRKFQIRKKLKQNSGNNCLHL